MRVIHSSQLVRALAAMVVAALLAAAVPAPASADAVQLRIGRQIGLGYLPLDVMQAKGMVEEQAHKLGIKDITVTYRALGSPTMLNDGLMSGDLDMAAAGSPPMLLYWDKTKDTPNPERMVAALGSQPMLLVTSNPNVKTIKDFGPQDRIAVPAPKISTQSVILGIAADKQLGPNGIDKFATLQVAMAHPDAMTALLSGSGITAHFGSFPFQDQELKDSRMHVVLDSHDVLGGPSTIFCVWGTTKFHDANPKVVTAFLAALQEADAFIAAHPKEAVDIYLQAEHSTLSADTLQAVLRDPKVVFTTTPQNLMQFAAYMEKAGLLTHKPASWKDVVFPELAPLHGS